MTTPIVPVAVFPGTANVLSIRGVGPVNDTGCPNYLWELQYMELVTRAIPAVPAIPATDDTPEVPEAPAVAATYSTTTLTAGNNAMTQAQWYAWGAGAVGNEAYQLSCIAENLGLTIQK